jgi:hypothetical protein
MSNPNQQIEELEAAALRIEDLERVAEERFDAAYALAEAANDTAQALKTPEFRAWMDARAETDEAWCRWATAMDARAAAE